MIMCIGVLPGERVTNDVMNTATMTKLLRRNDVILSLRDVIRTSWISACVNCAQLCRLGRISQSNCASDAGKRSMRRHVCV